MKLSTYPPFRCHCLVAVQLAENHDYNSPDVKIKVSFYIQHWGDIYRGARSMAERNLGRLGVVPELLATASYETEDEDFYALEPRGVRREHGEPVEAYYFHDPKKRDLLIRQRRLVPDSLGHMRELYGKPVAVAKADAEAVPA